MHPENQDYESSSPRILVVDDDEDSRYVTSLRLSRAGYLVDQAVDGVEAWEALLATRYDLLLTDHNMPRLCGLDLVARLRAAGLNLPVILYSGWPGFERRADYSNLRLAAIIPKSPNFAEVPDTISRILSARQRAAPMRVPTTP